MSSLAYATSPSARDNRFLAASTKRFDERPPECFNLNEIELAAGKNRLQKSDDHMLVAIISGSAECHLLSSQMSKSGSFSRGALFVLSRDQEMTIELDRRCKALTFNMKDVDNHDLGDSQAERYGNLEGQIFRNPLIFQLLLTMDEELLKARFSPDFWWQSASAILMAALEVKNRRTSSSPPPLARCSKSRLEKATRWIDENLSEKITVDDLVRISGVSEWHFIQEFKATYHRPPHSYIVDCRLAKAQELLTQPDLRLSYIAYECGFSSQSHLTTAFKQRFGITPGQFRSEKTEEPNIQH